MSGGVITVGCAHGYSQVAAPRLHNKTQTLAPCPPPRRRLSCWFLFRGFFMRHVLSAVVQNVPGVLAHISGMLASRGYNIDSLAVGETENPDLSRMTFVIVGDDRVLEQVRRQLEKIVTVVHVDDTSSEDFVERDLMLIKVRCTS